MNLVSENEIDKINYIQLYSSDGKLVYVETIPSSNSKVQSFKLPKLDAGIYFMIGYSTSNQNKWKLVIKN